MDKMPTAADTTPLLVSALLLVGVRVAGAVSACDTDMLDGDNELFLAPAPGNESEWRRALGAWKRECTAALNDSAPIFAEPGLLWTQTSYIQPQMHPYDRYFYEPSVGYKTDFWLDDLERRYGGVDAILFWPTYTNIGVDDRNQYDLVRALPGGAAGIAAQVAKFHARGVKVLLPYK